MKANIKPSLSKSPIKIKKPNPKSAFKSFFAKHNVLIIYCFLTLLLFLGIIFMFSGKTYAVSIFIGTQILFLVVGLIHAFCSVRFIEWIPRSFSTASIIYTLALGLLGGGLIILSNYWSALPEFPMAYSVGLLLFMAPVFLMAAFDAYMDIPQKVWKSWSYPYGKEVPVIEVINPVKINFYITKKKEDEDYAHFALNVPIKYKLSEFMHYFIHRYNYDKNSEAPIYISDNNEKENLYKWVFRTKPDSDRDNHLLDPELSFSELGLKEMDSIIVERYEPSTLLIDDSEDEVVMQEETVVVDEQMEIDRPGEGRVQPDSPSAL